MEKTQTRRLASAVAIIVALIAAIALSGAVERGQTSAHGAEGGIRIEGGLMAAVANPAAALAQLEALSDASTAPPIAFLSEIGLPAGCRDVRATAGGSVVGFIVDADEDVAKRQVDSLLASRGWTAVPLGSLDGSTYVKRSGALRWALVTNTQVGGATSVVVRTDAA